MRATLNLLSDSEPGILFPMHAATVFLARAMLLVAHATDCLTSVDLSYFLRVGLQVDTRSEPS
jgi:hypothetical protein